MLYKYQFYKGWILVLSLVFVWTPGGLSAQETIVVVGDSLSSGYGIPVEKSWVAALANRLRTEGYGYQVINASIPGDTSAGGLARLPPLLEQHRPRILIIELGGNDGLRGQSVSKLHDN
ncbi:MAG: GDSL-type esterase/lipase family protein, partial [Pseudomonadota bacterium]|nr:GDSL-type esterase/lipase family protein [Pseudomonadota bacterium]